MADLILSGSTSGTVTVSAPAVSGSSVLTLPASTDTLVGKATTDTLTNKTLTGAVFTAMPAITNASSMVRLNTANGYGSTNNKIRRFLNTVTNQGSDITYADSDTLGASFTINTNGVYAVSYSDSLLAPGGFLGLSLNSSQLTTSILTITVSTVLAIAWCATNEATIATLSAYFTAGDVIRPHTDGTAVGVYTQNLQFTITRVA